MIDDLMTCHLLLDDLSPSTSQPCAASGRRIVINTHIHINFIIRIHKCMNIDIHIHIKIHVHINLDIRIHMNSNLNIRIKQKNATKQHLQH